MIQNSKVANIQSKVCLLSQLLDHTGIPTKATLSQQVLMYPSFYVRQVQAYRYISTTPLYIQMLKYQIASVLGLKFSISNIFWRSFCMIIMKQKL